MEHPQLPPGNPQYHRSQAAAPPAWLCFAMTGIAPGSPDHYLGSPQPPRNDEGCREHHKNSSAAFKTQLQVPIFRKASQGLPRFSRIRFLPSQRYLVSVFGPGEDNLALPEISLTTCERGRRKPTVKVKCMAGSGWVEDLGWRESVIREITMKDFYYF